MKLTDKDKFFLGIIGCLIVYVLNSIDNKIDRNFELISGISARVADVEK